MPFRLVLLLGLLGSDEAHYAETKQAKSFERFGSPGSPTRLSRSRVFRSRPACPQLREQTSFFLPSSCIVISNRIAAQTFCWWLAAAVSSLALRLELGISHPVFPTCLAEVGNHDRTEAPDLFRNLTFFGGCAIGEGSAVKPPGQGSGSAAGPAKARD